MSQPDSEADSKALAGEPDPAAGTPDRGSEGVHCISIEDIERRIVPKEPPAPAAQKVSSADDVQSTQRS